MPDDGTDAPPISIRRFAATRKMTREQVALLILEHGLPTSRDVSCPNGKLIGAEACGQLDAIVRRIKANKRRLKLVSA